MNKDYEVIFYMKNGDNFKVIYRNTTKENLLDYMTKFTNVNSNNNFFGDETMTRYVNLNEVNCFEIKEKIESEN